MHPMDADELRSLFRVLTFGTDATRRALATRMADDFEFVRVLGETIRSDESEVLRARCREVLEVMAESGSPEAIALLAELNAPV
jgi:hypothetical protein